MIGLIVCIMSVVLLAVSCIWLRIQLWHYTADLDAEKQESERLRERLADEQKRNNDFQNDMDAIMNFHGEMHD